MPRPAPSRALSPGTKALASQGSSGGAILGMFPTSFSHSFCTVFPTGGQKRPLKINKFLCRCGLASPMGDQGQLWLFGPPESLATPFGLNAGLCSFGDHLLRSRQLPGARVCPSSPILSSPSDRVRACSPAVRARLRTELGEIVPNAYHLAAPGRRHIPPGPAPLSTLPKARIAPHSARRAFQKRPTWRRRSSRRST